MSQRRRVLHIGGKCAHGHTLTPENVKIRRDRRDCVECRLCHQDSRARFIARKPLYDTWKTMLRRCDDPTFTDWHLYGGKPGRPIAVCDRWRESFDAFTEDMGARPRGTTLDRIDSSGDYTRENCRWTTPTVQARNTSRNHFVTHAGLTLTIAEWAEHAGVKYMTLFQRLRRGMSLEDALKKEVQSTPKASARNRRSNHRLTHNGETLTIAEWAERAGLTTHQLAQRLRQGWTLERAMSAKMRHYGSHKNRATSRSDNGNPCRIV